jgi:alkylation response protein AidB-like acyl-CoA dehydrogenase
MEYTADLKDIKFLLFEVLKAQDLLKVEKFADFGKDDYEAIIEAAYAFAVEVLAPLNDVGDKEGLGFGPEGVTTPTGFKEAWNRYTADGWIGAIVSQDVGGQGLPVLMGQVIHEFFLGANISFTLVGGLSEGVIDLIHHFGNEELKARYLPGLLEKGWGGTMCLTEDNAGSDVGASRTIARPQADGTYLIEGTKIFITGGDQDMSKNIVHATLARVEGDPAGTKGLSLFMVPKYRVNADGNMDATPVYNDVRCARIEHKMGIKASPTAVMNFGEKGDCVGYLLGEQGAGMKQMFHMMNEARIMIGCQGLGLAGAAYEKSRAYAMERLQGSDIEHMKDPKAPKVAIINHPDVRRMLMFQKAAVESMRGLLYMTAMYEDLARESVSEEDRNKYRGYVELLTPICKSWCSDLGFKSCDMGLQVLGGYGYTNEYPLEQFVRDARIGPIYEGTNGIQAMDFIGRKVPMNNMKNFQGFLKEIHAFANENSGHPILGELCGKLKIAANQVAEAAMKLLMAAMSDLSYTLSHAYMMQDAFGEMLGAWMILKQAVVASAKLDAMYAEKGLFMDADKMKLVKDNPDANFYYGKIKAAEFFCKEILPFVATRVEIMKSGDKSAVEMVF